MVKTRKSKIITDTNIVKMMFSDILSNYGVKGRLKTQKGSYKIKLYKIVPNVLETLTL